MLKAAFLAGLFATPVLAQQPAAPPPAAHGAARPAAPPPATHAAVRPAAPPPAAAHPQSPAQTPARPGAAPAHPGAATPPQAAHQTPAVPPQTAHPAPAAATPGRPAPPAAGHPAPATPPAAGAAAARPGQHPSRDSIVDSTTIAVTYMREVYNYQGAARDPFSSLVTSASASTSFADLRLVSVLYDARGGRSVAVVRDKNRTSPMRLRRGDQVGRLRVIQIRPYEVVFQVEEFGFERQEVLTLQRPEVNR
jgi:hypothetical protein